MGGVVGEDFDYGIKLKNVVSPLPAGVLSVGR